MYICTLGHCDTLLGVFIGATKKSSDQPISDAESEILKNDTNGMFLQFTLCSSQQMKIIDVLFWL